MRTQARAPFHRDPIRARFPISSGDVSPLSHGRGRFSIPMGRTRMTLIAGYRTARTLGACAVLTLSVLATVSSLTDAQARRQPAMAALTVAVEIPDEATGTLIPARRAFVCVGDSTDTKRYGSKVMTNATGEIALSVPIGTAIVVTAWDEFSSGGIRRYTLGGREVVPIRSRTHRVTISWDRSRRGMTCNTPVLTKALPTVTPLRLGDGLRTMPQGLSRTRSVELLTTRVNGYNYIDLTAPATHFRVSQRSDFRGAAWQAASVHPLPTRGYRMRSVQHEILGGDGRKTIFLQLRNDAGSSPVSQVGVDYVDLYACRLIYRRAPNAMETLTMAEETLTVMRAASKTLDVSWPSPNELRPGYGMHLRWARNNGDHPIELTVGGGVLWIKAVLDPRDSERFRADLRTVRCP
jgi:uncharacterized membrane protein